MHTIALSLAARRAGGTSKTMTQIYPEPLEGTEVLAPQDDYKDNGFEMFNNPPSMWPSFLVGQRDKPVRTIVIDDDIHFVNVLLQELALDERIQVVGRALNFKDGKRLVRAADFDVLIVDLNLTDRSGELLLELAAAQKPGSQSIVCTASDLEDHIRRALELGASGYLLKHSWFGSYAQSILQVANGGAAITPHLVKRLLNRPEPVRQAPTSLADVPKTSASQLSARELDVLRMVANGNTSLEIASLLQISHMTVNTHIRNTYRKLQVRSRAQAVQSAMLRGLI